MVITGNQFFQENQNGRERPNDMYYFYFSQFSLSYEFFFKLNFIKIRHFPLNISLFKSNESDFFGSSSSFSIIRSNVLMNVRMLIGMD